MVIEWREMSPAQVWDAHLVFDAEQVAYVLNLKVVKGARAGKPDPRQVLALVERGKLRPVDAEQPVSQWTFSRALVEGYLARPDLVLVPLAVAS